MTKQGPELSQFAETVLGECERPITINSHEFYISASIGISRYPDDGASLEDLLKNADMAMYAAKRAGGSSYSYFTRAMNNDLQERVQLEASLRKAIKNEEFILHYQPKYDIDSGKIIGVEALIRWNHPEFGMIYPSRFIYLAEETGLIMQIGEWVMREACRACKTWQDAGHADIGIAVNVSPKQFRHQDIAQLVSRVLAETGLKPHYLEIEITESTFMDDIEATSKKLNDVKHMGVKISIDDFGTGYTSINYLKQFTVSYLKIDQNFVNGIPANPTDIAIIIAVIALSS